MTLRSWIWIATEHDAFGFGHVAISFSICYTALMTGVGNHEHERASGVSRRFGADHLGTYGGLAMACTKARFWLWVSQRFFLHALQAIRALLAHMGWRMLERIGITYAVH